MAEAPEPAGCMARRRHHLVLVLALNSGATDALGVLALGGAFTSVMTGNMVLTGLGAATADWALVLLAVTAIVCFSLGCAVGAKVAGTPLTEDTLWPRPICWALLVQLVLTICFAVAWWLTRADPSEAAQLAMLAGNAACLGIQSSAVQRLGQPGLSTTYLTGTLTTLVVRLATGHGLPAVSGSLQILLALVGGAALGAALTAMIPMAAPVPLLLSLAVVLTIGLTGFRDRASASAIAR